MIHSRLEGPSRRRIAIIAVPRPQQTRLGRLGVIRQTPAPVIAWTTLSDATPDSADNWLSSVWTAQQTASMQEPGTLVYTPAPVYPPAIAAPWNTWNTDNCDAGSSGTASTPATPATSVPQAAMPAPAAGSNFWAIVGLIGAAAGLIYLAERK